jgi:hypothetical protein
VGRGQRVEGVEAADVLDCAGHFVRFCFWMCLAGRVCGDVVGVVELFLFGFKGFEFG